MKKRLLITLSILALPLIAGCSTNSDINGDAQLVDRQVSSLQQQVSWLVLEIQALKDINAKLLLQKEVLCNNTDIIVEPEEVDMTVYDNSNYWFSLDLGETWGWYITETQWNKIIFWFTEQPSLFTITALTHSEWDIIQQDLMWPTYLWENDTYVFVYSIAQDAVTTKIADRMWEINGIFETLSTDI